MNKISKNEHGFSAVELIVVIVIVALIGTVGWSVYKNHHKTTMAALTTTAKTTTTKPATTKKTTTAAPALTTFKVPELGIEITNVPASISDLNDGVISGSASGSVGINFSTVTLTKLDPNCAPNGVNNDGILTSYQGTYNASTDQAVDNDNLAFVKQFNGFWIGYSHPESQCSDNTTTEALHTSQTATFDTLVTNPANLEAIQ